MLTLKLAYRNLIGAGLRTWLNVIVLSFTYVLIIWHQGMFSGMYRQASRDYIKDEIGGGQYWADSYDPYDPFTLEDSHRAIHSELAQLIRKDEATPILIQQGTIYPGGRMQSILIKGINPFQKIMDIPSEKLQADIENLPVMIGRIMAKKNSLKIGDSITIRWRDANGTFDATDGEIVEIMQSNVPTIDQGQIWVPLKRMEEMYNIRGEATIVTISQNTPGKVETSGWVFRDHAYLLKDLNDVIKSKRAASSFIYIILLFLAMLAIFDTQILSIFRRRKEIGTLMALGMIRTKVIMLFTLEGLMHGILGIAMAALYGIPMLILTSRTGIPLPGAMEEYGYAISTRLFPTYSPFLIGITVLIVMITVTIVSYLPSRRIARMEPTEALKGKLS